MGALTLTLCPNPYVLADEGDPLPAPGPLDSGSLGPVGAEVHPSFPVLPPLPPVPRVQDARAIEESARHSQGVLWGRGHLSAAGPTPSDIVIVCTEHPPFPELTMRPLPSTTTALGCRAS